jgi:LPS sulfotransferase NodH
MVTPCLWVQDEVENSKLKFGRTHNREEEVFLMQAGKSVIFCATQRTGSTVIFEDFRNVLGYGSTYSETLYDRIILRKTERAWSEVWDEVNKLCRVEGYFVDKVMFHYTPRISSFIDRDSTAGVKRCLRFRPELFDGFYKFFANAIWVYVYRRDVFAQTVSMYLAEATEIWERRIGEPWAYDPQIRAIRYDRDKLKEYLEGFLAEREQWQVFFRHYNITPIRISYEEAAAGCPQYLRELLDKTGLQMVEAPWQRRLLKLGDQSNEKLTELLRNDVISHPGT